MSINKETAEAIASIGFFKAITNLLLRSQLKERLETYTKRVAGKDEPWEFDHPQLAHRYYKAYRDAYYKKYILKRVLSLKEDERVTVADLVNELTKKLAIFSTELDGEGFTNALGVIATYIGIVKLPLVK